MKLPRRGMGVAFLILGFLLVELAFSAIPEGSLVLEGVGGVFGIGFLLVGTGFLMSPMDAGRLVMAAQLTPTRRVQMVPSVPRPLSVGFPRRSCPTCGREYGGDFLTCPVDGSELTGMP